MARTASRTTPNLGSQPLRGTDFERAHSPTVLVKDVRARRRGFTIVELLIVVVVIAILAAITIVAYNGIANRSKAAAASAAAEQAAKKVLTYAAVNSDQYPATLSDAGVSDGSATYQYRVDNSASPKTFCLTATTQNMSSWVSSTATTPTPGACAGHGVNGGGTITNLARMPIASESWAHGMGTSGSGSRSVVSDARFPGGTAYQLTWSTAPTSSSSLYVSEVATIPCVIGQQYAFYVRYAPSWSGAVPNFYLNGPGTGAVGAVVNRGDGTYEARANWTATAACTSTFIPFLSLAGSSTLPSATSTLRVGGFMVVADQSGTVVYADGDSAGWVWNGATNSSTSTGPAL
ncbi:prepilin-type N-terminal cleavage/methylation domain-containing protein [uncultured Microbacterium sp.]|uniref:prepilin-type N-terminal cleavage/methylation domain-containing protein n=1 Tax=uncultured Microbacterium sp. TaxID=191216 RepID=UPI0030F50285